MKMYQSSESASVFGSVSVCFWASQIRIRIRFVCFVGTDPRIRIRICIPHSIRTKMLRIPTTAWTITKSFKKGYLRNHSIEQNFRQGNVIRHCNMFQQDCRNCLLYLNRLSHCWANAALSGHIRQSLHWSELPVPYHHPPRHSWRSYRWREAGPGCRWVPVRPEAWHNPTAAAAAGLGRRGAGQGAEPRWWSGVRAADPGCRGPSRSSYRRSPCKRKSFIQNNHFGNYLFYIDLK